MFRSFVRWFSCRVKWKTEEDQTTDAGQWIERLSLRGHSSAEGFSAGIQRQIGGEPRSFRHCSPDGSVCDFRGIRTLRTFLHVWELVTQRAMPRSDNPSATAAINGWFIPAPAPCAKTKQAFAFGGDCKRPETHPPSGSEIRTAFVSVGFIAAPIRARTVLKEFFSFPPSNPLFLTSRTARQ